MLLAKSSYSCIVERTLNMRLIRTDINLNEIFYNGQARSGLSPTQRSGRQSRSSLWGAPRNCKQSPAKQSTSLSANRIGFSLPEKCFSFLVSPGIFSWKLRSLFENLRGSGLYLMQIYVTDYHQIWLVCRSLEYWTGLVPSLHSALQSSFPRHLNLLARKLT